MRVRRRVSVRQGGGGGAKEDDEKEVTRAMRWSGAGEEKWQEEECEKDEVV